MNAKHTPVLKPCLICSGPVNIKAITVKKTPKTGFRYWQIICDKCNLKLESNTRDGVINLWTRAPETAAELERLMEYKCDSNACVLDDEQHCILIVKDLSGEPEYCPYMNWSGVKSPSWKVIRHSKRTN